MFGESKLKRKRSIFPQTINDIDTANERINANKMCVFVLLGGAKQKSRQLHTHRRNTVYMYLQ